jgi:hypothetical protein
MRGSPRAPKVSAVTAHTSASIRSGERPDDRPSSPKSHNAANNRYWQAIQLDAFYTVMPI